VSFLRIAGLQLPTLLVQEGGYDVAHLGQLATNFLAGFARGNDTRPADAILDNR